MPLPTYLAWLQPINCNSRFVYIHVNIGKAFTCGIIYKNKAINNIEDIDVNNILVSKKEPY